MPETIENKVQCPKCGYSFPITDAVLGPLRSQITTELEKGFQIRIDKGREEIEKADQALQTVFNPASYSRIGLRYINVIKPVQSELGGDMKWSELLTKYVIGELGDTEISDDIVDIKSRVVIRIPDVPNASVTLTHGLDKQDNSYRIDADFSVKDMEENYGTIRILDSFNRLAGRLFRWAITDTLHEAMGPHSVE